MGRDKARFRAVTVVGAIAIAVATAGTVAAAAPSGRSPTAVKPVVYTDAVGDQQGASPDITQVKASNDDAGVVTLEVDLRDPNTIAVPGTEVDIFVDADRNRYTGDDTGEEYVLSAVGGNPAYFDFYTWNGTKFVTADSSLKVSKNGGGILFFTIDSRDLRSRDFGFEIFASYTDSTGKSFYDYAPEADLWRYTLHGPDTDGDGLPDEKDACPAVAPSYDPNHNGCPGPYRVMTAKISGSWTPDGKFLTPLSVSRLPAGAHVTVTCRRGCHVNAQRTVGSDGGAIGFRQFKSKTLARGGLIEVRVTKKGWIGYVGLIRGTGPPKGLAIVEKCQPPDGGAPAPCATVGQGS